MKRVGILTTTVRTIITALLLAAISGATHAQTVQRIEIVEYGIYAAEKTGTSSAPGTAFGEIDKFKNFKLVTTTRTVPARVGVTFGYRFNVVGQPNGATVRLRGVNLVPQPGIRNPTTGNTMLREEASVSVKIGGSQHDVYTFTDTWEVVRGTWTFELWEGDRKLSSQIFNVQ